LMSGTIADDAKITLKVECGLVNQVTQFIVDQPFKVRGSGQGHAILVAGAGYTWASDSAAVEDTNSVVLPIKESTRCDLEFYGTRSSFDLSTYATIFDHVNSDAIYGAAIGTLLGKGVNFAPRPNPTTGDEVWDVSVKVAYLSWGWRQFWREKTPNAAHPDAPAHAGGLDTPKLGSDYVYPEVAMSTLLTGTPS